MRRAGASSDGQAEHRKPSNCIHGQRGLQTRHFDRVRLWSVLETGADCSILRYYLASNKSLSSWSMFCVISGSQQRIAARRSVHWPTHISRQPILHDQDTCFHCARKPVRLYKQRICHRAPQNSHHLVALSIAFSQEVCSCDLDIQRHRLI